MIIRILYDEMWQLFISKFHEILKKQVEMAHFQTRFKQISPRRPIITPMWVHSCAWPLSSVTCPVIGLRGEMRYISDRKWRKRVRKPAALPFPPLQRRRWNEECEYRLRARARKKWHALKFNYFTSFRCRIGSGFWIWSQKLKIVIFDP